MIVQSFWWTIKTGIGVILRKPHWFWPTPFLRASLIFDRCIVCLRDTEGKKWNSEFSHFPVSQFKASPWKNRYSEALIGSKILKHLITCYICLNSEKQPTWIIKSMNKWITLVGGKMCWGHYDCKRILKQLLIFFKRFFVCIIVI